jgi:hypothetical protein
LKSEGEVTSLLGADKREVRDNREKWWEYREKSKYFSNCTTFTFAGHYRLLHIFILSNVLSFYLCVTCLKQYWCRNKFYYSILFIYYLLDNSWLSFYIRNCFDYVPLQWRFEKRKFCSKNIPMFFNS